MINAKMAFYAEENTHVNTNTTIQKEIEIYENRQKNDVFFDCKS